MTADADIAKKSDAPVTQPDSIAKLVIVLTLVAMIAAAALAAAHELTKNRIKASRARVRLAAISKVLPKCTNDPVKDALTVKDAKGKKTKVYRCRQQQQGSSPVVAVAIEQNSATNKHKTYSGLMQVLVGIDARTGKVRTFKSKKGPDVGVVILKHSETPGLGSKAEGVDFRKAFGGRDLKGKDDTSDGKKWACTKDNPALGFVDAISGATITSRAVMELVQKALAVFNKNRQAILTAPSDAAAKRQPAKESRP